MADFYSRLAPYYDQMYRQIDHEGNSAKLHDIIQQYKKSEGIRWLDVACGTGTHIMHLKDKYDAMGFDLSEEMLVVAREKCPNIKFVQGNMVEMNLGQKFDVITCLFGSIGYLTKEEELERAICAFSKHTDKGGVVIIEPMFTKESFREGSLGLICLDLPEIKIARVNRSTKEGDTVYLNFNFLITTRDRGPEHFIDPSPMSAFPRSLFLSLMEESGLSAQFIELGLHKEGIFIGAKE
ncbi:class I SAM-dependent methyltransferase [Candidatus Thorarchaeota archaeon]|nr:MAG: class I SAM-dependent methyltransferase [Candidatus Thorarchaeota archaeon]